MGTGQGSRSLKENVNRGSWGPAGLATEGKALSNKGRDEVAVLHTGHGWPLAGGLHGPQRGFFHVMMAAAPRRTAVLPLSKGTVGHLHQEMYKISLQGNERGER